MSSAAQRRCARRRAARGARCGCTRAHAGGLRRGRPGRGPRARRRGAGLPRGPGRDAVRGTGAGAPRAAARRDRPRARRRLPRDRAQVPAAREPRPAARRDRPPASPTSFVSWSSSQPRVVATLGSFATALLSGRALGITRVHGQEQEVTLGGRRRDPLPALPPGGGALHARRCSTCSSTTSRRLPELLAGGGGARVDSTQSPAGCAGVDGGTARARAEGRRQPVQLGLF